MLCSEGSGGRRIAFASSVALREGVRPGQSLAAATALVPSSVRLDFAFEQEASALHALGEALLAVAPGFQVDAPEGLWLDAGAAGLFGGEGEWGQRVLELLHTAGFDGRLALASNRFTARAVARWTRGGSLCFVPGRGAEAETRGEGLDGPSSADGGTGAAGILAPLPLEALEAPWVEPATVAMFRRLGLATLGEVAALAEPSLVARFGASGRQVARLCRGADDSLFVPAALSERLVEAMSLEWPAEQLEPVLFAVKILVDRLCLRLQGRRLAAVRLIATLELEGLKTRAAHGAPAVVRPEVRETHGGHGAHSRVILTERDARSIPLLLSRPSARPKLLLELFRQAASELVIDRRVVGVSLEVLEHCANEDRQLSLGDAPVGDAGLEVVLAKLQAALGGEALFSAEPVARHRPEASWRATRFSPPEASGVGAVSERCGALNEAGRSGRPSRLFPAPSPLQAELAESGALSTVTLLGRRRRVLSLSGPERLVGEWWDDDSYARDYFRAAVEGVGELWIFRDGRDGRLYAQGAFD